MRLRRGTRLVELRHFLNFLEGERKSSRFMQMFAYESDVLGVEEEILHPPSENYYAISKSILQYMQCEEIGSNRRSL